MLTGSPVAHLVEGQSVQVSFTVCGPLNSMGEFDPPQTVLVTASSSFVWVAQPFADYNVKHGGPYDVQLDFADDGWWLGNGTASDDVEIEIQFAGREEKKDLTIHNVAPKLLGHPNLTFLANANGDSVAQVTVGSYYDPGVRDNHTIDVQWADIPTKTTGNDDCEEVVYQCPTSSETIKAERVFTSAADIYPLTITLKDDDLGEVAPYKISKFDVMVNYNDDNANGVDDRNERGYTDLDIRSLDLSGLVTSGMDKDKGYFELSFGSNIKLWNSQRKDKLYVPEDPMGMNYPDPDPNAPPTIKWEGQSQVWVEGMTAGQSTIRVAWIPDDWMMGINGPGASGLWPIYSGAVVVRVWKPLDLDIDSDNDNGFDYPENDEWEEHLENHTHGIGKLIFPDDTHFVPVPLRLPQGLNPHDPTIRVLVDWDAVTSRGELKLWTGPKADTTRSSLLDNVYYPLHYLRYDPAGGGITLWAEAVYASAVSPVEDLTDIYMSGKPDDWIKTKINNLDIPDLKDDVKFMITEKEWFYPTLAGVNPAQKYDRFVVRNGLASHVVYNGVEDGPQFALQKQTEDEARKILEGSGLDQPSINYVLGALFDWPLGGNPAGPNVGGLEIGLYQDYEADKDGVYVLAIAGTEFDSLEDAITNLYQVVEPGDPEYVGAIKIGGFLGQVASLSGNLEVTGHSLGGGLASAAALAGNIPADTFNAAGLQRHTLCEPNSYVPPDPDGMGGVCVEIVSGSLARYDAPEPHVGAGLIDAYRVWWSADRPNGSADVPDILSLLQLASPLVPTAAGGPHYLEGFYNFNSHERAFARSIEFAVSGITSFPPDLAAFLNLLLTTINALGDTFGVYTSTINKLVLSHGIAQSVMFGLLHDDATGWNAYDDNNPNLSD